MQPESPLTQIPNELMFHWITGHATPSRKALKILLCSGVKLTCTTLNTQINHYCLGLLTKEWKAAKEISTFMIKWIKGSPKIGEQVLYDLISSDFHLKLTLENKKRLQLLSTCTSCVPFLWTSPNSEWVAYSLNSLGGDIAVIDLTHRLFLGEILSEGPYYPIFNLGIQPIFYKDVILTIFLSPTRGKYQMHIHSLKDFKLVSYTSLPLSDIRSIHLIDDHLVFHLKSKFAAIPFDQLSDLNFIYSDEIEGLVRVETFCDKLLFFQSKKSVFVKRLRIADQSIKFQDYTVKDNALTNNMLTEYRQAFHARSKKYVFIHHEVNDDYKIGSISEEGVIASNPMTIKGLDMLLEYKDTLLLCSRNNQNKLQIQIIDRIEEEVELQSLDIQEADKLNILLIPAAKCFLDKLFLICSLQLKSEDPQYHLIIVDMTTLTIEKTHPLGAEIINQITFISIDAGKVHLMLAQNNQQHMLKIDYT